jgi:Protein of unknown function (DUF1350)
VQVVATPFATGWDHMRLVDEAQFQYERCLRSCGDSVQGLPLYGVGHSLGSLLHLLINAGYATPRPGNVLLSYNNKPATDRIPFLSPLMAPSARVLGPILSQACAGMRTCHAE